MKANENRKSKSSVSLETAAHKASRAKISHRKMASSLDNHIRRVIVSNLNAKSLTRAALAKTLDIHPVQATHICKGTRLVQISELPKIAKMLGIPIADFFNVPLAVVFGANGHDPNCPLCHRPTSKTADR